VFESTAFLKYDLTWHIWILNLTPTDTHRLQSRTRGLERDMLKYSYIDTTALNGGREEQGGIISKHYLHKLIWNLWVSDCTFLLKSFTGLNYNFYWGFIENFTLVQFDQIMSSRKGPVQHGFPQKRPAVNIYCPQCSTKNLLIFVRLI
jgi:hypothetical protein